MKKIRVLFVCIENAGRSQMAEGYARSLGLDAESCGSRPAGRVNPLAIEAMREKDIDLAGHKSKGFESVQGPFDFVVTMGCGDACPLTPARERRDWELPDPKGGDLEEVRRIRDEIGTRVRDFSEEIARQPG